MKKRILLIYTGGTIGMNKSENGYAPQRGFLQEILEGIPALRNEAMPDWELLELDPLLDSSNTTVVEWNCISGIIKEHYHRFDGFVILHGTDTMAYTASALSFSLENLDKPVILTGSQIPLFEIRNDALANLLTSMLIAAEGRVREVALCFDYKLLRGNRSVKRSTSDLDAFYSPNFPPLAEMGTSISYNHMIPARMHNAPFRVQQLDKIPIGIIKVFPGIQFELFEEIMTESLKGIVLEAFGAGNIPGAADAILPIVRKAYENGTVLVICSQCLKGSVTLGAYETSSALKKAGAVCAFDMTTEAAVAKLYYLFSCGYDAETVKQKMEEDLRGEITVL
ncbi:MAG: asparaginase [Clostridia bacterium]|nr:asparaginase [Clostridia bacterium]